ncbi:hypothetical protein NA56DRAFT_319642 [Hyaloscypha hepaticicola]|uniref:Uncharacterized protein n=1 Tax=Hyaloscypha hepaticicola TaxID=2082293 RepID=A0A2J6PPV3_9HELO|nr:hypothetical protein NA56DRAFT_319642 [Hyaloscypha hepaticicola]
MSLHLCLFCRLHWILTITLYTLKRMRTPLPPINHPLPSIPSHPIPSHPRADPLRTNTGFPPKPFSAATSLPYRYPQN